MQTINNILSITFKLMLILVALATWGVVDIVDMIDDI
jgi:hypothetical protein